MFFFVFTALFHISWAHVSPKRRFDFFNLEVFKSIIKAVHEVYGGALQKDKMLLDTGNDGIIQYLSVNLDTNWQ